MKNIYKIASVFLITASIISCDNYFDVNTDPNNPLVENTNPDIVLPGALSRTGADLATRMNEVGNFMTGAWSGNVVNIADPFADEFRYNVTSNFYNGIWDNLYRKTSNFTNIINYTGDDLNYANHKAIARIMKAFYFQYLVDLYGDIPYFEAHKATENLTPSYDDAQVVYGELINELNLAIANIQANTSLQTEDVSVTDVMMNGNMDKWIRFANTIKLRILLRQSNMTDATVQALITSELNGLTTANFVSTDVTLNPGYSDDSGNNRQNPFYGRFGFETSGSDTFTLNNRVVASVYSIELLDGTLNTVSDPRLGRLWTTDGNPTPFQGIQQGDLLANLPLGPSTVLSRLGAGLGVNTPNAAGASQNAYIMTAAESLFLQAEAIERGYITGNAKTLFDSGITASMNLLGASIGTYLTDIDLISGLGWNGAGGHLEAIAQQKFNALMSVNGAEAWIEYSRTGFPTNLPISLTNTSGDVRPVKLLYPQSEISGNTTNVPVQNTTAAFNNKIFWDVN